MRAPSKLEVLGASVVVVLLLAVVLLVAVVASAGVGLGRDEQSASERPASWQPRIEPPSAERSGETNEHPDPAALRAGDSSTGQSGLPEVVAHSAEPLRAVGAELGLDVIVCRVDVADRARAWSTVRIPGVDRHLRAPARMEAGWLVAPVDREQGSVAVAVDNRAVAQVDSCAGATDVEQGGRFSVPAARGECELTVQVVGADGRTWCWSAGAYTVGPSDLVEVHLRPDPDQALDSCRPRSEGRIVQGWYETLEMAIAERRR